MEEFEKEPEETTVEPEEPKRPDPPKKGFVRLICSTELGSVKRGNYSRVFSDLPRNEDGLRYVDVPEQEYRQYLHNVSFLTPKD